MQVSEALQILDVHSNTPTLEEVKAAYRRKAREYHPDINYVGLHMMQIVNSAYEVLEKYKGPLTNTFGDLNLGPDLEEALKAVISVEDLKIEICGVWIWVSGNTQNHKDDLKQARYRWAPSKKMWYFRPDHHSFRKKNINPFSMDEIRAKFGSQSVSAYESKREATRYFSA